MKLDEAYKIVAISNEEKQSLERYLGFKHTSINILGNLTSEAYRNLQDSGWLLQENEQDLMQSITDFVNVYALMYKDSGRKHAPKNLVRGTSNELVKNIGPTTSKFLSTYTDENVAKTFCKYSDAALVYFGIGDDVLFLDAEDYRSENNANEHEIILAPFCEVVQNTYASDFDGYKHYRVELKKARLDEKTSEELDSLLSQITSGFAQNLADIKEYLAAKDHTEILNRRFEMAKGDNQDYMASEYKATFEKATQLASKTNNFKTKLQSLLRGLCKQKELEIDKAKEVIREEQERKTAEQKAKELEDARKTLVAELSAKVANAPTNTNSLENTVISTYEALLASEEKYKRVARGLGVSFGKNISSTSIKQNVTSIQDNIKAIDERLSSTAISNDMAFETAKQTFSDLTLILDGISYGLEVSSDFADIVKSYSVQAEHNLKKELYTKVQIAIKNAKIQKYLNQREVIEEEPVSLFGRLFGKSTLKNEQIRNMNLKMKLVQTLPIEDKQTYSVRDMLADIYTCAMTDLEGDFTSELGKLYMTITAIYQDTQNGKFTNEYISRIASQKSEREGVSSNLPDVTRKMPRFFGKTRARLDAVEEENEYLENQILAIQNRPDEHITASEPDALTLFEQKLKGIATSTRYKQKLVA